MARALCLQIAVLIHILYMLRHCILLAAAALAAHAHADSRGSVEVWNTTKYSWRTMPRARFQRELDAHSPEWVVCADNGPLGPWSALQLLDTLVFTLSPADGSGDGAASSLKDVSLRAASEDSSFSDLFNNMSARVRLERQLVEQNGGDDGGFELRFVMRRMGELRAAVVELLRGPKPMRRFSPFKTSCVAIGLRCRWAGRCKPVNIEVEARVERAGALRSGGDADRGGGGPSRSTKLSVALLLLGAVIMLRARRFAESTSFHYGGGVLLAILFGVFLFVFVAIHRLAPSGWRRRAAQLAALTGWAKALTTILTEYLIQLLQDFWPWIVAYVLAFGLSGYFYTFWCLRGNRPEAWQCSMAAQMLRLLGALLLLWCSSSARGSVAVLCGVLLLWLSPRLPLGALGFGFGDRPARAPDSYDPDAPDTFSPGVFSSPLGGGARRRWRPAAPASRTHP